MNQKWLVTTKQRIDLVGLAKKLSEVGAAIASDEPPVPLEPDEQAIQVIGPGNLPARLQSVEGVRGVYPISEIELY